VWHPTEFSASHPNGKETGKGTVKKSERIDLSNKSSVSVIFIWMNLAQAMIENKSDFS
jgi:hypothetical protein